jgi:hypothetical protein
MSQGSANNALGGVNRAGANQTATTTLPAGVTFACRPEQFWGNAAGLTFDPQTRQLYLSNARGWRLTTTSASSTPFNSTLDWSQCDAAQTFARRPWLGKAQPP